MNVLALCAGAGGLELGLRLAVPDARTVCYVEGEAYVASLLVAHMEAGRLDTAPVWSDVRTFDGTGWRETVDCITAGYPCQPFSIAGKKRAAGDPRHLWPHVARITREIQPQWCFFENVAHHLSLGFEQVCHDLGNMGYAVAAGLFSAEEVGAPHRRERLFIVAYRDGNRCQHQTGASAGEDDPTRQTECAADTGAGGDHPASQFVSVQHGGFAVTRHFTTLPDGEGSLAKPTGAGAKQYQQQPWECTGRNGQSVADPAQPRLEGYPERQGGTAGIRGRSGVPLWPPYPRDLSGWETVPDDLKPSVHRMADGLAYRVDRIRACGNGVVPLAAAYAWRTLRACFNQD